MVKSEPVIVKVFGPYVELVQTFPKLVKADADKEGLQGPLWVSDDAVKFAGNENDLQFQSNLASAMGELFYEIVGFETPINLRVP